MGRIEEVPGTLQGPGTWHGTQQLANLRTPGRKHYIDIIVVNLCEALGFN